MLVETMKVQCEETAKSSDKMDLFVMKLREINNVEIKINAEVDQRVISIENKIRDEANFEKAKEKWEINRTRVNDNIGRLNTNDRQLYSKVTEIDNELKEEIASLEYKIESTKREPITSSTKIGKLICEVVSLIANNIGTSCILGMDWMVKKGAKIDIHNKKLLFDNSECG
ncbi:hypothetical protein FQA39_LY08004 [Lamprigera yunnana]|nr:hypothetical protein FQA39_LY08004 [Lamprigera yunnana]